MTNRQNKKEKDRQAERWKDVRTERLEYKKNKDRKRVN